MWVTRTFLLMIFVATLASGCTNVPAAPHCGVPIAATPDPSAADELDIIVHVVPSKCVGETLLWVSAGPIYGLPLGRATLYLPEPHGNISVSLEIDPPSGAERWYAPSRSLVAGPICLPASALPSVTIELWYTKPGLCPVPVELSALDRWPTSAD